jgi:hypothetical protein
MLWPNGTFFLPLFRLRRALSILPGVRTALAVQNHPRRQQMLDSFGVEFIGQSHLSSYFQSFSIEETVDVQTVFCIY